jgi:hypothetical protein
MLVAQMVDWRETLVHHLSRRQDEQVTSGERRTGFPAPEAARAPYYATRLSSGIH